jgi:hypothetical protein
VLALGVLLIGLPGIECAAEGQVLREVPAKVHPDLPEFRFVLQGSVDGALATIERITVYVVSKREPAQVITVGGATTSDVKDAGFFLEDMNFDGYVDFRVQAFVPAGPNTPYLYWLYDSASGGFKWIQGGGEPSRHGSWRPLVPRTGTTGSSFTMLLRM